MSFFAVLDTGIGAPAHTAPEGIAYWDSGADTFYINSDGAATWKQQLAVGDDHGLLSGLPDDDHTQYALLAGRAAGQTLEGGIAASENLILQSTAHVTRGAVRILDQLQVQDGTAAAPAIAFTSAPANGFYTEGAIDADISISLEGGIRFQFRRIIGIDAFFGGEGNASLPGYSFIADSDTGMFHDVANQIGWAVAGVEKLRLTSSQLQLETKLHFDAAHAATVALDIGHDGTRPTLFSSGAEQQIAHFGETLSRDLILSSATVSGNADFFSLPAGLTLRLLAATTAFIYNIGGKQFRLTANVDVAVTNNAHNFVWISNTGVTGVSTLPCIYNFNTPAGPATDQHWYDLGARQMKRFDGATFVAVSRIFIGYVRADAGTIAARYACEPIGFTPYDRFKDCGDGSDGFLDLSAGTTTLDGWKNYTAVIVRGAAVVNHSLSSNTYLAIKSQGPIIFLGTSRINNLGRGTAATAGATGTPGAALVGGMLGGGGGGGGGTNAGGPGGAVAVPNRAGNVGGATGGAAAGGVGAAGTPDNYPAGLPWPIHPLLLLFGSGGGGGGGSGAAAGGDGGRSGGATFLVAPVIAFASTTSVTHDGAAGAAGPAASRGGGGGGGGGYFGIFGRNRFIGITPTVAGGAGGASGGAGSGAGGAGAAGLYETQSF